MSYHQSGKAMLSVERDGDSLYATAIPLTGIHTDQNINGLKMPWSWRWTVIGFRINAGACSRVTR